MKELGEDLKNNAWLKMSEEEIQAAYLFADYYIDFLNRAKTEREAVDYVRRLAQAHGFQPLDQVSDMKPGDKIYMEAKGKICALVVVGHQDLRQGINLIVSHIDTPRLDLKPRPLYEAEGLGLLKTHYYGGIKKYQWLAIPLALHGVVLKKDGTRVDVCLGEDEDDLVLTIADLLPHLAKEQMEQKMADAIKGESLNALIGSRPEGDTGKDPVKAAVLKLLQQRYDIEEDDFTSAELQLVPAFKARHVGLDRSMVGGYGQDDRICAYTALRAILDIDTPQRTAMCLLADKEEIGSSGNTGLQSLVVELFVADLMQKAGYGDYYTVRKALADSYALSADVNGAVDPNYPDVFEKMNNSFLGRGVVLTKYTGSRGKYDSNDANPEFLSQIRRLFDDNRVIWQVGELGKVDAGGGGTVAQYVARYGMEVVDCGPALLGMHSPFEISSKADLYMTYKAYKAFFASFAG
ncbi:MAG TPA: aminopeptidase [Syntrophomonadaceae bacterium]|nr:aminopeptidase [Syntrophomonadaceae bacterium]HPU48399.1 aminopeptidase [Syntrophomonadaceae bacterium]